MIKIKVTEEMTSAIRRALVDPRRGTWEDGARAVAEIVERDVNQAMVLLGQFGGVGAKSGSAEIEVEGR